MQGESASRARAWVEREVNGKRGRIYVLGQEWMVDWLASRCFSSAKRTNGTGQHERQQWIQCRKAKTGSRGRPVGLL